MYKWGFIPFHSPFIRFLPGASSQLGSVVVKHGDRFCPKDPGCGLQMAIKMAEINGGYILTTYPSH